MLPAEFLSAKDVLRQHRLRHTACREEILEIFLEADRALSHADLEENLSETSDRVTVYRTLKTFVEKEILHKVLDDSGNLKYAMQKESLHSHIHFKCNICGITSCLENTEIPVLPLPPGYTLTGANLLAQGVCQVCNKVVL
jgi:Fur family transcriptional regulator, ferric uptake regulator